MQIARGPHRRPGVAGSGHPVRVGLIGAGKFGTMFLAQARRIPGLHVLGVADLSIDRACEALTRAEWPPSQFAATGFENALKTGGTHLTDDGDSLVDADGLDVLVEATGNPMAGIRYARRAIDEGRHLVMVNVEADVLAGPVLARRAESAGLVYSLAYGDQPALICELVDWARTNGFDVVCAGKGTKHRPVYHESTPDTVWDHYGIDAETAVRGGMNPRMFNSFLDGTKSAIEMAAVANATGLEPQPEGLNFPPCGVDRLPDVCRPRDEGGQLSHKGTVEVVSCVQPDGTPVDRDLRWGVYVTIEGSGDYIRRCFTEYGLPTDASGRYTAVYRPYHLVGMELATSVMKAGLHGEATGSPRAFLADVAATAKRDLAAGETLDGEGGYRVYGKLMPAGSAVRDEILPIGLAHALRLKRGIAAGHPIHRSDVELDEDSDVLRLRREMEVQF
ncbi:MAG: flagellar biosynthesis protein FlgA [Candidatus Latescibacteria bacterium]|nr:flagellar biosynthesis protein FlgA [Candidatus Latescibacterota bacterium]